MCLPLCVYPGLGACVILHGVLLLHDRFPKSLRDELRCSVYAQRVAGHIPATLKSMIAARELQLVRATKNQVRIVLRAAARNGPDCFTH